MDLKEILRKINRPARYIDHEQGAVHKDWAKTKFKCCLCFPDKYEIGMSNLGMEILYFLGNELPEVLVERCYAPDLDLIEVLKREKFPLFSLESGHSLKDFDLICFSVPHELNYTNVLLMLDLAGIPLLSSERKAKDPLIIVGGQTAFNPEPLGDLVDAFVVGEGEGLFEQLLNLLTKCAHASRQEKLMSLKQADLSAVYFPDLKNETRRHWLKKLDDSKLQNKKLIPFLDVVHNRCAIEVMRGCLHGCRFCQAVFVTRPLRPKSIERVLNETKQQLEYTGFDEISLLSLTVTDHPQIEVMIKELNKNYAPKNVNISLPSLRTDSVSEEILKEIQRVRKSTVTIAPEAGSQKLRDSIHKDMDEKNIFQCFDHAVKTGARSVKLYFMIGLPGETEEDVLAIPKLAQDLLARSGNPKNLTVTINVSTFVPKPHTPFQWARILTLEEIKHRQALIKNNIHNKRIQYRFHDPETSIIEGLLSRGDRNIGRVILKAYQNGCFFDGWQENFDFQKWLQAFADAGINYLDLLKEISLDQELPWKKIKIGIPEGYLKKEYLLALK